MRSSPLLFTLIIAVALGAISFPLRALTGRAHPQPPSISESPSENASTATTPTHATLRLLAPARSLALTLPDGTPLWQAESLDPGLHDLDLPLPESRHIEILLHARFDPDVGDTALFLTLMPDHQPAVTAHAIGQGEMTGLLTFAWDGH